MKQLPERIYRISSSWTIDGQCITKLISAEITYDHGNGLVEIEMEEKDKALFFHQVCVDLKNEHTTPEAAWEAHLRQRIEAITQATEVLRRRSVKLDSASLAYEEWRDSQ